MRSAPESPARLRDADTPAYVVESAVGNEVNEVSGLRCFGAFEAMAAELGSGGEGLEADMLGLLGAFRAPENGTALTALLTGSGDEGSEQGAVQTPGAKAEGEGKGKGKGKGGWSRTGTRSSRMSAHTLSGSAMTRPATATAFSAPSATDRKAAELTANRLLPELAKPPRPRPYDAVVFDLDGTLADSRPVCRPPARRF